MKKLILILGDQLDVDSAALKDINPKADEVLMVESANEAQHVWSHKARIALFLSAMRHFAEHLKDLGFTLTYIQHSPKTIVEELSKKIGSGKFTHLVCVEPGEWRLKQSIEALALELNIVLEMRQDSHFYCTHAEFKAWVANKKELRLEYFYRLMRKTYGILIDQEGNPEGGQWNFDRDNRKPFPKKGPGLIPPPELFAPDAITKNRSHLKIL